MKKGLSSLMILFCFTTFAQQSTSNAPVATRRPQPSPRTALQSRLNSTWTAPFRVSNTNAHSAALARATGQAGLAGPRAVDEVGPNHRSWKTEPDDSTAGPTNKVARARSPKASVVEIGSGMNYWDGQQWSPSVASFDLTVDAFVANRVQHRKRLSADLNVVGAVTTTLRDGTTLRSSPVAIALYDPNDGRFAVVSTITNSVGVLVSSNKVVYSDAFSGGVCADVVYTLQKGSFEQDVIITGRLNPLDYGFPTNAQIQVVTEFYDPPQPEKLRRPIYVEKEEAVRRRKVSPDLIDEVLGFGELVIGTGKAYTPPTATHTNGTRTVVAKEFRTNPAEGRTFLIETVNCLPIQKALNALPECAQGKRTAQQIRKTRIRDGYVFIPKPGPTSQVKVEPKKSDTLFAEATPNNHRGVVIDYVETLDAPINQAKVFQSDVTYFVTDAIYCNGPVTIEGGAVFKYWNSTGPGARATFLQFNNALTLKTGPYRPAIFTAWDDDSVGDFVTDSFGDPTLFLYANPAIIMANYLTLSYCRFSYANVAVQCDAYEFVQATVNHSQFVNCVQGISIIDYTGGCGSGPASGVQVVLNNILMAGVSYPLEFTSDSEWFLPDVYLTHCTIAGASLLKGPGTGCYAVAITSQNSIFANIGGWGGTLNGDVNMTGDHNGFYPAALAFGSNPVNETEPPFAPIGYVASGQNWYFVANAQAGYYLREGSLFVDAGNPNIPQWLKNDLTGMTTVVPALFNYDVNSSQTLGPTPIRDADTPDLGYHYSVVDYVLSGATVNNCTLNIDQGTVLGFTTPYYEQQGRTEAVRVWNPYDLPYYEWGIRLNPGGRLNVNGVPTNRVVFSRLEAVQESPAFPDRPTFASLAAEYCPVITFKGLVMQSGAIVTPLAEARVRYADFPTLASPSCHIGDLALVPTVNTHDLVQTFELDGCTFGKGWVLYETASATARTLTYRNNIFERSSIDIENFTQRGNVEETLEVRNNLFYYCKMYLGPVSGNNWKFTDNIFDHVSFEDSGVPYNGPVADNHHNGYVGMTTHLSPPIQPTTDPDLTSLAYQTGPLGQFYLPTTATLLVDKGSQLAKDAGLYHFTSFTINVKEGNETPNPKQVNIGPHYLALVNSKAADSNGDGVPDFLADRNGNGIENSDEMPWNTLNTSPLAILTPVDGAINVSGIVPLRINLGASSDTITSLIPFIDGETPAGTIEVLNPGKSVAELELDTRYLPDGSHAIFVEAFKGQAVAESSAIITVSTANEVRYADWSDKAEVVLEVNLQIGSSQQNYGLYFFNSSYPIAYDPMPTYEHQGVTTTDGNARYTEGIAALGISGPSSDPNVYVVATPFPRVLPPIQQFAFPVQGRWAVAYADDYVDYNSIDHHPGPVLDPHVADEGLAPRWCHDKKIGSWIGCGAAYDPFFPTLGVTTAQNPTGRFGQTLPARIKAPLGLMALTDSGLVLGILARPEVVNFFGAGHGVGDRFMGMNPGAYKRWITHRYRFAFLDGCQTGSSGVIRLWGADAAELKNPDFVDLDFYTDPQKQGRLRPGAFLGWKSDTQIRYYTGQVPFEDPTTHQLCYWRQYEASCNWHAQLVASWVNNGQTLSTSIQIANDIGAAVPGSYPPRPGGPPGWTFVVSLPTPAGMSQVTFNPATCLKRAGYGGLRFKGANSFNLDAEWPH